MDLLTTFKVNYESLFCPAVLILAVPTYEYSWVPVGTHKYLSESDLLQVLT
jgi:hypothetical protein